MPYGVAEIKHKLTPIRRFRLASELQIGKRPIAAVSALVRKVSIKVPVC